MNRYEMLTSKEEEVLCLIWDNKAPMTAVEISELMEQRGWSKVTALKTVQDLTESGRLEIVGVTRVGKAYPRILYPSCTKNEYFSDVLHKRGFDCKSMAGLVMAFMGVGEENSEKSEDLIKKMEIIIDEIRSEGEENLEAVPNGKKEAKR